MLLTCTAGVKTLTGYRSLAFHPVFHDQTRRLFGGRHPLWGIGVTSLIAEISRPAACSARMADSRPAPGPFTQTSTRFKPRSIASLAADSAAICAANGVLFREFRNVPPLPPLDQLIVCPCRSARVTIVLLKVALIWATPIESTCRSRLRERLRLALANLLPPRNKVSY